MVGIHSHILPGVDDGPATIEDAVSMVRMAHAAGTTDIGAFKPSEVRHQSSTVPVGRILGLCHSTHDG